MPKLAYSKSLRSNRERFRRCLIQTFYCIYLFSLTFTFASAIFKLNWHNFHTCFYFWLSSVLSYALPHGLPYIMLWWLYEMDWMCSMQLLNLFDSGCLILIRAPFLFILRTKTRFDWMGKNQGQKGSFTMKLYIIIR